MGWLGARSCGFGGGSWPLRARVSRLRLCFTACRDSDPRPVCLPHAQPAPTCKDPVWAALLALNVVVQAILAVVYGIPVLNSAGTDEVVTSDEGSGKGLSTRTLGIVFVICVGLGAVASVLFLLCLVRCAERLVRVTVFASIGLNVLLAIVSVFLSPFLALIWIM